MKILKPLEKIYHFLVGNKNYLYNHRIIKSVHLKVPILSVGNISFGGVGKTPFVVMLANEMSRDFKINIVTRSYKAQLTEPKPVNLNLPEATGIFGDEACLIQKSLPGCQVWSGPHKASTAAASIISQPDLIILDDGFSHRRLNRNFDLVLIDATQGFDDYLREPITSLRRAQAVVITKVNLVDRKVVVNLEKKITAVAPKLISNIFLSQTETELKIEKNSPLFVFCGLGRPESFVTDLEQQGFNIAEKLFFADHHAYSADDQKNITEKFLQLQQQHRDLKLVTTEKDFIKITDERLRKILTVTAHRIKMDENQKGALIEKIRQSF